MFSNETPKHNSQPDIRTEYESLKKVNYKLSQECAILSEFILRNNPKLRSKNISEEERKTISDEIEKVKSKKQVILEKIGQNQRKIDGLKPRIEFLDRAEELKRQQDTRDKIPGPIQNWGGGNSAHNKKGLPK